MIYLTFALHFFWLSRKMIEILRVKYKNYGNLKKNKFVPNDSKMSHTARNDKIKLGLDSGGISTPFLYIMNATSHILVLFLFFLLSPFVGS